MTSTNTYPDIPSGTYLITGITGYIGSAFAKMLINSKEYAQHNIHIIGLIRNKEKAATIFSSCNLEHVTFITGDLVNISVESFQNQYKISTIDYIIHCAANTKSHDMITSPVETSNGILLGTSNILTLARFYQIQSMVYLSSMEVYGSISAGKERIGEDTLGDLDILNVRSCYPLGKRMAENLCYCYHKEYGVPVKIARLAQTFGPNILPNESRIFAQFARCAKKRQNIILHTKGDSVGNYVDIRDAVTGILVLLTKGTSGESYNIVNEANTMTILEMASLVASKLADNQIQIIFDIPKENTYGYAPKTELRLSSKKIQNLGWRPDFGLIEMYQEVIQEI